MDELDDFRQDVRTWLDRHFPAALSGDGFMPPAIAAPSELSAEHTAWKTAMADKGWGTPTWPRPYGGGGLSKVQARVLAEEMAAIGAWNPIVGMGVMMLGPTLLEFGNEAQKLRHLPPIARGEVRWCQGFSEPGAGSDLASLRCRAEKDGDAYLVNGQKLWTSGAHWADWCFALVRTDTTKKHAGISFLLIDMRSPGVTVRQIAMISGASYFCETFFTDVRVPITNMVVGPGEGWNVAKRLLEHERASLSGRPPSGTAATDLRPLFAIALEEIGTDEDGKLADPELRARIAGHLMAERAFALTRERAAIEARAGADTANVTSILKNAGTRVRQSRAELIVEMKGLQGMGVRGDGFTDRELATTRMWLADKAITIYGGSSEIQRNIIARRVLGLPDYDRERAH